MQANTKNIVATMAYLIGVKDSAWKSCYEEDCPELFDTLEKNESAKIIRSLCKLRTTLTLYFKKTDQEMRYGGKSLYSLEWHDRDAVEYLESQDVKVVFSNKRSSDYCLLFNKLISEKIENCRDLFPDWLQWEYIKKLFIIPRFMAPAVQKAEFEKYMAYREFYPFQCYIYWKPEDKGSILFNDEKFVNILYEMNGDVFNDATKCKNVGEDIKENIYDFIDNSAKTILVVDCENSDVYKLYSVLKNLSPEEVQKISKIVLHDDVNTTNGWDYLEKFIDIPVEHLEINRVTGHKSLVDISVTAGVCKEFYSGNADSFILLSSDSDYWGLISALPDANFLIMLEYEKCGTAIREALVEKGIYYCYMDRFCSGNIEEFKRAVLLGELRAELPYLLGRNGKELAYFLFEKARIEADGNEVNNFYDKYIKSLKLIINDEGEFEIEVKN